MTGGLPVTALYSPVTSLIEDLAGTVTGGVFWVTGGLGEERLTNWYHQLLTKDKSCASRARELGCALPLEEIAERRPDKTLRVSSRRVWLILIPGGAEE